MENIKTLQWYLRKVCRNNGVFFTHFLCSTSKISDCIYKYVEYRGKKYYYLMAGTPFLAMTTTTIAQWQPQTTKLDTNDINTKRFLSNASNISLYCADIGYKYIHIFTWMSVSIHEYGVRTHVNVGKQLIEI